MKTKFTNTATFAILVLGEMEKAFSERCNEKITYKALPMSQNNSRIISFVCLIVTPLKDTIVIALIYSFSNKTLFEIN